MGMSIMPCRPALERLPDVVGELQDMSNPAPWDAGSPAAGAVADFRGAAGRLADILAPALPGVPPAATVNPALQALLAADLALRAEYDRMCDYRTRPMVAEGSLLYESVCVIRDIQDAMQEPSARYVGAIEQAVEPFLAAIIRAEQLQDELIRAGHDGPLADIADEEIVSAEANARAGIAVWRRPNCMPALRAVLARRNRLYLLD